MNAYKTDSDKGQEEPEAAEVDIVYPAEKEKMWLFAVEFTTILKDWNHILDSYNYNDNDEYKKKHGTDCAFIVEIDWYNKFARYA